MTVEAFTPSPVYIVAGTGPYEVTHPYREGTLRLTVWRNGVRHDLAATDYTAVPSFADVSGAVVLSPDAAEAHAGGRLFISRETLPEQGWEGTSSRERGLEEQLDWLTNGIQDVARIAVRSLRGPAGDMVNLDLPPAADRALRTLMFDATGRPTVGQPLHDNALATAYASALLASPDASAARNVLAVAEPGNRIINGNFSVWQRGVISSGIGYVAADRWLNLGAGGTVTQERVGHTLGNKFGRSVPQWFLRQTVTGQSLAAHHAATGQRIESVRSFVGETISVCGWARRNSGAGNMVVELRQRFGTGGSPTGDWQVGTQLVPLQGAGLWTRFVVTFDVPGIANRALGTNGDDHLALNFWASAGQDFSARVGGLIGLQTISLDLFGIHILPGVRTAQSMDVYQERTSADELADCERYYEAGSLAFMANVTSGSGYFVRQNMRTTKRASPAFTRVSSFALNFPTAGTISGNAQFVQEDRVANGSGTGGFAITYTADAEL